MPTYLTSHWGSPTAPAQLRLTPRAPFGTCPTCPNNPQAIRNYDGLEFRLTKTPSRGSPECSATPGAAVGQLYRPHHHRPNRRRTTGRNSPDTTRSFDEPFYYFGANGKSNDGPLPTDRPNAFKGYAYYTHAMEGQK